MVLGKSKRAARENKEPPIPKKSAIALGIAWLALFAVPVEIKARCLSCVGFERERMPIERAVLFQIGNQRIGRVAVRIKVEVGQDEDISVGLGNSKFDGSDLGIRRFDQIAKQKSRTFAA